MYSVITLIVWLAVFFVVCRRVDKNSTQRAPLVMGGYALVAVSVALALFVTAFPVHFPDQAGDQMSSSELPKFVAQFMVVLGGAVGGSFLAHGLISTKPK